MFEYIKTVVANGTTMWGQYDPAAPFYGWDVFTIGLMVIGVTLLAACLFAPGNKLKTHWYGTIASFYLIVAGAASFGGFVAADIFLRISNAPHNASGVFVVWGCIFWIILIGFHHMEKSIRLEVE